MASRLLVEDPNALPLQVEAPETVPFGTLSEAYGEGEFVRGLRRGTSMTQAMIHAAKASKAMAEKDKKSGLASLLRAKELLEESAAYAPKVESMGDVTNLGTALKYAAGKTGEGVASTALPALGGLAGGLIFRNPGAFAGATVPAYQLEKGEAVLNALSDPEVQRTRSWEDVERVATAKGGLNALGEAVLPAILAGKTRGLAGTLLRGTRTSAKDLLKRGAGTMLEGFASEGFTEAGQEYGGQLAATALNPNRDTSQDVKQIIEAGVAGGMTGTALASPVALSESAAGALRNLSLSMAEEGKKGAAATQKGAAQVRGRAINLAEMADFGVTEAKNDLGMGDDRQLFRWLGGDDSAMPVPQVVREGGRDAVSRWLEAQDIQRMQTTTGMLDRIAGNENQSEALRAQAVDLKTRLAADPSVMAEASSWLADRYRGRVILNDVRDYFTGLLFGEEGTKKSMQGWSSAADTLIEDAVSRELPEEVVQSPEVVEALSGTIKMLLRGEVRQQDQVPMMARMLDYFGNRAPSLFGELIDYVNRDSTEGLIRLNADGIAKLFTDVQKRRELKRQTAFNNLSNEARLRLKKEFGVEVTPAQMDPVVRLLEAAGDPQLRRKLSKSIADIDAQMEGLYGHRLKGVMESIGTANALGEQDILGRDLRTVDEEQIAVEEGTQEEDEFAAKSAEYGLEKEDKAFYGFAAKAAADTGFARPLTEADALARVPKLEARFPNAVVDIISAEQYVKEAGVDPVAFAKTLDSTISSRGRAMKALSKFFVHRMSPQTTEDPITIDDAELNKLTAPSKAVRDYVAGDETNANARVFRDASGRTRTELKQPGLAEGYLYFTRGKDKPPLPVKAANLIYLMRGKDQKSKDALVSGYKSPNTLQYLSAGISGVLEKLAPLNEGIDMEEQGVFSFNEQGKRVFLREFGLKRLVDPTAKEDARRNLMIAGETVSAQPTLIPSRSAKQPAPIDLPPTLSLGRRNVKFYQNRIEQKASRQMAEKAKRYTDVVQSTEAEQKLAAARKVMQEGIEEQQALPIAQLFSGPPGAPEITQRMLEQYGLTSVEDLIETMQYSTNDRISTAIRNRNLINKFGVPINPQTLFEELEERTPKARKSAIDRHFRNRPAAHRMVFDVLYDEYGKSKITDLGKLAASMTDFAISREGTEERTDTDRSLDAAVEEREVASEQENRETAARATAENRERETQDAAALDRGTPEWMPSLLAPKNIALPVEAQRQQADRIAAIRRAYNPEVHQSSTTEADVDAAFEDVAYRTKSLSGTTNPKATKLTPVSSDMISKRLSQRQKYLSEVQTFWNDASKAKKEAFLTAISNANLVDMTGLGSLFWRMLSLTSSPINEVASAAAARMITQAEKLVGKKIGAQVFSAMMESSMDRVAVAGYKNLIDHVDKSYKAVEGILVEIPMESYDGEMVLQMDGASAMRESDKMLAGLKMLKRCVGR